MDRIGLFGGSFDPVHSGHLLVARAACEELALNRLFFIPACQSPFKPDLQPAPARQRLRLLRLALTGFHEYELDTQEIDRGGISFTIDTVRDYRRRFPAAELFYLIGADQIIGLPKWKLAEEVAAMVEFIIIPRPGQPPGGNLPAPFKSRTLIGFPFGVSSSQIRARVKSGLPVRGLVPDSVEEAIRNNALYL